MQNTNSVTDASRKSGQSLDWRLVHRAISERIEVRNIRRRKTESNLIRNSLGYKVGEKVLAVGDMPDGVVPISKKKFGLLQYSASQTQNDPMPAFENAI